MSSEQKQSLGPGDAQAIAPLLSQPIPSKLVLICKHHMEPELPRGKGKNTN
jgi:hypothetical protein